MGCLEEQNTGEWTAFEKSARDRGRGVEGGGRRREGGRDGERERWGRGDLTSCQAHRSLQDREGRGTKGRGEGRGQREEKKEEG